MDLSFSIPVGNQFKKITAKASYPDIQFDLLDEVFLGEREIVIIHSTVINGEACYRYSSFKGYDSAEYLDHSEIIKEQNLNVLFDVLRENCRI